MADFTFKELVGGITNQELAQRISDGDKFTSEIVKQAIVYLRALVLDGRSIGVKKVNNSSNQALELQGYDDALAKRLSFLEGIYRDLKAEEEGTEPDNDYGITCLQRRGL